VSGMPGVIGVVGAGTMGAGIAQLAAACVEALGIELGEERYRAAPLLRRVAGYHGDAD
jgi:3-hydroxyacyl-CoA dehydrogenase